MYQFLDQHIELQANDVPLVRHGTAGKPHVRNPTGDTDDSMSGLHSHYRHVYHILGMWRENDSQ